MIFVESKVGLSIYMAVLHQPSFVRNRPAYRCVSNLSSWADEVGILGRESGEVGAQ
jgi:hypothetical protein